MTPFFKSFIYAFNGIKLSLKQRNMKIHVACALLTVVLGWLLHITATEWCVVLICIGIVLSLETINTAIESFVDLVEPAHHPVAGKIKDLAAAAVLVFSVISAIIGLLIFGKYIVDLLPII
ncbi:MAG: diacylglycerol kinase family protein [Bacteroidetes bacterium]|nr:diacylglycerol kinase family protein [Bacteroidota bacterium]